MTERVNGFFVALDHDIRTDDFETIKNAVLAIKHVIGVEENIDSCSLYVAQERFRSDMGSKIVDLIYDFKRKETK